MNIIEAYYFVPHTIFFMPNQANAAKTAKSQERIPSNNINKVGYKQEIPNNDNFTPTLGKVIGI